MTLPSATHLVLIPSYNAGPRLVDTVRGALAHWRPVWVVVDGSTDGSAAAVQELAAREPDLRVIVQPHNGGKGAAVATGVAAALGSQPLRVQQEVADLVGDGEAASLLRRGAAEHDLVPVAHLLERGLAGERLARDANDLEVQRADDVAQ